MAFQKLGVLLILVMAGLLLAGYGQDEKMIGYAGPPEGKVHKIKAETAASEHH